MKYGNWRGVYNRLRMWAVDGTWERIFSALLARADTDKGLNWAVAVDSTIVCAHHRRTGRRRARLPGGDGPPSCSPPARTAPHPVRCGPGRQRIFLPRHPRPPAAAVAPADTVYIGADEETLAFPRARGMRAIRYRTPADCWHLLPEQTRLQAAEDYVLHRLRTDTARTEVISDTGERRVIDELWSPLYLLDASETMARSQPSASWTSAVPGPATARQAPPTPSVIRTKTPGSRALLLLVKGIGLRGR